MMRIRRPSLAAAVVAATVAAAGAVMALNDIPERSTVRAASGGTHNAPSSTTTPPGIPADTSLHPPPDCPETGEPNGPSNVGSVIGDYAPGTGEATPEAALEVYLAQVYPAAPESFRLTGRTDGQARFENEGAVLLVSFIPDVGWVVDAETFCRPRTATWRGGRR